MKTFLFQSKMNAIVINPDNTHIIYPKIIDVLNSMLLKKIVYIATPNILTILVIVPIIPS